jgi:hypothetical protein
LINPGIPVKDLMEASVHNVDLMGGYEEISMHPDATFELVMNNPQFEWSWRMLSEYLDITVRNVRDNPHLPWNVYGLCSNPHFTLKDILDNFHKNPDLGNIDLTSDDTICFIIPTTLQDIVDYPDLMWDWSHLCNDHMFELDSDSTYQSILSRRRAVARCSAIKNELIVHHCLRL